MGSCFPTSASTSPKDEDGREKKDEENQVQGGKKKAENIKYRKREERKPTYIYSMLRQVSVVSFISSLGSETYIWPAGASVKEKRKCINVDYLECVYIPGTLSIFGVVDVCSVAPYHDLHTRTH